MTESRPLFSASRSASQAGRACLALLAALAWLATAGPADAAVAMQGTWRNNNFLTTGASSATLAFDGLGNASFTFTTDNLCGSPGNRSVTLTGPVDPDDYSWSAQLDNHPVFGDLQVAVSPSGAVTGSSPSAPGMFNGSLAFTGQLRLQGTSPGLDLDVDFTCGGGPTFNTTHDLDVEGACTPSPTTLCLNNGRFRASLVWRPQGGQDRPANTAVQGTADSGLFYFNNSNNWEVLLKVLNACTLNNRYWVFMSATTNVRFTLTVTDTLRGAT
jgi:hypothetical protein